jgi:hypothetical protein
MSELKTYSGGCHCGKVRYEVQMELGPVIACNCSICSKKGYLLAFVPAGQFKLLSGEGELTDYQFNKHVVHHLSCKTCGIQSFSHGSKADGTKMYSVNVRCLDGIDVFGLEVKQIDSRAR